jgi:hypothetical protein
VTAVLSTTCLQFKPLGLLFLVKTASKLGNAGLAAPAAAAVALARSVGRYRLSAVTERYVREPERS